jgi:RHS repeat-associated protein
MNPFSHRTVLLATDSSQSIIGEIVDGGTNTIAYSAYGEQSAQQQVETRLGFNGQLREAKIGWYMLGNGYRAYNPRLMRFNSPDSWSPFGRGGLNAYMYCVGDPINRADPTGHGAVRQIGRLLASVLDKLGVVMPGTVPKKHIKFRRRFGKEFNFYGVSGVHKHAVRRVMAGRSPEHGDFAAFAGVVADGALPRKKVNMGFNDGPKGEGNNNLPGSIFSRNIPENEPVWPTPGAGARRQSAGVSGAQNGSGSLSSNNKSTSITQPKSSDEVALKPLFVPSSSPETPSLSHAQHIVFQKYLEAQPPGVPPSYAQVMQEKAMEIRTGKKD